MVRPKNSRGARALAAREDVADICKRYGRLADCVNKYVHNGVLR